MQKIRITKVFHFEAAHALKGYHGPCRQIHGHSYELSVTLAGIPDTRKNSPTNGMVIDFSEIKKLVKKHIVDPLDHSLILPEGYPEVLPDAGSEAFGKMVVVPYQPTSENLLIDMADKLKKLLPDEITLHHLKLRETATSWAEWHAEDND